MAADFIFITISSFKRLCLSSSNHLASCICSNEHSWLVHCADTSLACWMASSSVIIITYVSLWHPGRESNPLTTISIHNIWALLCFGRWPPSGSSNPYANGADTDRPLDFSSGVYHRFELWPPVPQTGVLTINTNKPILSFCYFLFMKSFRIMIWISKCIR